MATVDWVMMTTTTTRMMMMMESSSMVNVMSSSADVRFNMPFSKAVLRFYMAADVVLVASLNEVLPLVICESMAFERPVVCSTLAYQ